MTKPQEPKRYDIRTYSDIDNFPLYDRVLEKEGQYMLAEEALAYAEAVRNEALEEAAKYIESPHLEREQMKHGFTIVTEVTGNPSLAARIRSLKREGK